MGLEPNITDMPVKGVTETDERRMPSDKRTAADTNQGMPANYHKIKMQGRILIYVSKGA